MPKRERARYVAAKNQTIRVRLSPAVEGKAAQVMFTMDEKAHVQRVAVEMGYPARWGVSSFVRDCGVAAAAGYELPTDGIAEMLERAATDAGLKVGQWLRVVVLETIGLTTAHRLVLERQMAMAKKALEEGSIRQTGADLEDEGE